LSPEQELEINLQVCRTKLEHFVAHYLREELPLNIPEFHSDIYDDLDDSSLKRCVFIAPTGFGKSSTTIFAYPIWLACYGLARRIIIISSTSTFAERKLRDIKTVFESNEMIRNDFGIAPSDTWKSDEIILNNGVQILALGKGSQITGERPDVIIGDDIETEKEAKSEVERASLDYWWYASVLNRPAPDGRIILIGSISHKLAFLNRNFNNEDAQKVWSVKTYATKNTRTIWADKWTDEDLRKKRIELAPFPGIYEALYEADVSQIQRYAFKREWLRFYDTVPAGLTVFTTCDPAIGEAIHNDYTAIVTIGISITGQIYVLDVIKKRFNIETLELFGALFSIYDVFHPVKLGIETVGFQKFIKVFFEQECRKRGKYPNVIEIKHDTKTTKEARITSLAPLFQSGQIYLRRDMFDLISEYDSYPEVEHDDVLDALSMVKDISVPQAMTANRGQVPRYRPSNSVINF
jgi:predicted phage terminase large subunit-like protein